MPPSDLSHSNCSNPVGFSLPQIRFAEFELDLDLFKLERSGQRVPLGPRALDLLAYLIQHRRRVVSAEALRVEVWNGTALGESAIATCMSDLRRALRDDATAPRYIETVRGRGYRFIHPIDTAATEAVRTPLEALRNPVETDPDRPSLPFVGRRAELEILDQASRAVSRSMRGGLVLLRGEAGIGKTRLLKEFLQALPDSLNRLQTSPNVVEGSPPPFWPWTQLIRRVLADPRFANDALIVRAAGLSAIFPEIGGPARSPIQTTRAIDRFSTLRLWAETIRTLLGAGPTVLALEDLHLMDRGSLSLASWLVRELRDEPLLIVATQRPPIDDGDSARSLAELASSSDAIVLDLAPLTTAEIAVLLEDRVADAHATSLDLLRRSAGNPFLLAHLIRRLEGLPDREETRSLDAIRPVDADEITVRLLSDLPPETQRALEAGSVAGLRFSLDSVADLIQRTATETLASLSPAVRAGLVRLQGADLAFAHGLLREALYARLPPLVRRNLHLSMSRHLRGRAHPDVGAEAEAIADHLAAASPLAAHEDVVEYTILAAREAAARSAYALARRRFRHALQRIEEDPDSSPSRRGGLLLEYARARLYSGEREEARSTLLEAAAIARAVESPDLLAECALQLAPDFLSIEMGFHDPTLIALIEEALDRLPEDRASLRARLLARLCQARRWTPAVSVPTLQALSEQALSIAERSGEQRAVCAALEARVDALPGPDRVVERLSTIRRLTRHGRNGEECSRIVLHHVRSAAALLELGDTAAFEAAIDACDQAARQLNQPQYLWYPLALRASLALIQGRLDRADELGRSFMGLASETVDRNVLASRNCQAAFVQFERDRADRALAICADFFPGSSGVRAWRVGMALLAIHARHRCRALGIFSEFDEKKARSLLHETGGSAGAIFLAQLAILLSDTRIMMTLYEQLAPIGQRGATLGLGTAYFGCFARYSGQLARALGLPSEAIEHLRAAVRIEAERGAILHRAHAQIDLALALIGSSGSAVEARELVGSAARVASSEGLVRLRRRVGAARVAVHRAERSSDASRLESPLEP